MSVVAEPIKGQEARSAQNQHILSLQSTANAAVSALVGRGYTIIRVVLDDTAPLIWIQNCGLCGRLNGATKVRRIGQFGPERVMLALFEGCRVQWTIRGH